jgi:hypothetical protein
MRSRWSAIALAMLTLVLMPRDGQSQGSQSKSKSSIARASQNYPNPYNPETQLNFEVGEADCSKDTKRYRVTWKIINILSQVVAVPELRASSSGVAGGQKIQNVSLPCGKYTAYWNGKYASGREAASGAYIWILDVDGKRIDAIRSTVAK